MYSISINNQKAIKNERGAALVELAISFVIISAFVTGIISLGNAFVDAKIAVDTSRHTARAGAADSQRYDNTCSTIGEITTLSCNEVFFIETNMREQAIQAGCRYLADNGEAREDWELSAVVEGPFIEDTFSTYQLKVTATQKDKGDCLLCWRNLLPDAALSTTSAFTLERSCP